jgi:NAD(P)-dependent dehydrogenase (short-subunit alcohol dehydrogenase family)
VGCTWPEYCESGKRNPQVMLSRKIALVTGAGSGIGAAIARGLAHEGARVVILDVNAVGATRTAHGIREAGGIADALQVDVRDRSALVEIAARVREKCGPIDILINNAGIAIDADISAIDAAESWERTIATNLSGVFNVTQAFLDHLKESRGVIVNVASIAAFITSRSGFAYAASKGGVRSLTVAWCNELAPFGIRVNAIAPGVIETPMEVGEVERLGSEHWFIRRAPMGRLGQPDDLVGPVVFLASQMSAFVTGVVLPVDGGFLTT